MKVLRNRILLVRCYTATMEQQKKFNIQIPAESVPFKVNNAQKRVLEEMVIDLYDAVGRILIFEDEELVVEGIKKSAVEHFRDLLELILEEKKYIIEVPCKESILIFDVEEMIEKYGYDKEKISSEIKNLNLEELLPLDGTFVVPLFNYAWVVQIKEKQIKVSNRSVSLQDFPSLF